MTDAITLPAETIEVSEIRPRDKVRAWWKPNDDGGILDQQLSTITVLKVDGDAVFYGERGHEYLDSSAWEKVELLERPKPELIPGMVFGYVGFRYVILPKGWYEITTGTSSDYPYGGGKSDVVFDPREAKALPNPLDPPIKVGNRVRRENPGGVTIEFVVNHIAHDRISPAYGVDPDDRLPGFGYNPEKFVVLDREVPDRLPAGTITRNKKDGGTKWMCLRTEDGYIALATGEVVRSREILEDMVRQDIHEVVYLP